jgi:hypothetical protein
VKNFSFPPRPRFTVCRSPGTRSPKAACAVPIQSVRPLQHDDRMARTRARRTPACPTISAMWRCAISMLAERRTPRVAPDSPPPGPPV